MLRYHLSGFAWRFNQRRSRSKFSSIRKCNQSFGYSGLRMINLCMRSKRFEALRKWMISWGPTVSSTWPSITRYSSRSQIGRPSTLRSASTWEKAIRKTDSLWFWPKSDSLLKKCTIWWRMRGVTNKIVWKLRRFNTPATTSMTFLTLNASLISPTLT